MIKDDLALYAKIIKAAGIKAGDRIVSVDGQPVRARVFWGAPGASNIRIGSDAQRIEFEFTAAADADNGTFHFRFGRSPGQIFLDDIRVTDLDATNDVLPRCDFENGMESFKRDWTHWPVNAVNTVGSIGSAMRTKP